MHEASLAGLINLYGKLKHKIRWTWIEVMEYNEATEYDEIELTQSTFKSWTNQNTQFTVKGFTSKLSFHDMLTPAIQ